MSFSRYFLVFQAFAALVYKYTWVTSNSDRNLVIAIEVHALAHGHQQLGTGGIEEAVKPWPAGW